MKTTKSRPGNFHGVLAALVTPMKANEEIDYSRLGTLADHLVSKGVHALFRANVITRGKTVAGVVAEPNMTGI